MGPELQIPLKNIRDHSILGQICVTSLINAPNFLCQVPLPLMPPWRRRKISGLGHPEKTKKIEKRKNTNKTQSTQINQHLSRPNIGEAGS